MEAKDNGAPAFPAPGLQNDEAFNGMTLRDYFAAAADVAVYRPVETLEDKIKRTPTVGELAECIAQIRMAEADAMLAAREAKND